MKIIHTLSRWLGYIGVVLIMLLMLLIVAHVFMRFVFNSPITGTPELAALAMACLSLGAAWGAVNKRHITVDIFVIHLPRRVQAVLNSITLLASLVIFAIMTWRAFEEALWAMKAKFVASVLVPVPTYPFWLIYILGLAVFCIMVLTILIQTIKGVKG